ncbi:MAG: choice-of-anchor D domain-containing protein [Deltaproteobacteria bacterium]|nr:choice-of-anchor D domain-containing protein [Deltaproteobacteria bacterium]
MALAACPPEEQSSVELRILPASLDLGAALLGVPTSGTVSIVNDGSEPWDPSGALALQGDDAAAFAVAEPCALPLAPATMCTITVTVTITEPRLHRAELTIPLDPPTVVPLTATARGVRFSASSLDFGAVRPGRSGSASVVMENVGDEVLDVPLSVEGAGFTLSGGSRVLALGAGATETLDLLFAPSAVGAASGRLVADLCEDDDCDPSVTLSGVGAVPTLSVTPTSVDFGDVAAGSSADAVVTLQNSGGAELSVSAITLSDASGFTSIAAAPTLPAAIAPGASASVTLRYAPTQGLAALAAQLSVVSDDPATPNLTLAIAGVTSGPGLVASPPSVDFGTLDEGEALELDVTLRSSGTSAAQVNSIALDGGADFAIVGALPSLPLTLAVDDTVTVRVRASAGADDLGGRSDTLRLTIEGAGDRAVALGFAGGVSGCVPTVTQSYVDISNVVVGRTEEADLYVRNTGTTPCVLASAVPAPDLSFAPEISFDPSGLATIAPGASGALSFSAALSSQISVAGSVDVTFQNVAPLRLTAFAAGVLETIISEVDAVDLGILPAGCVFGQQAIVLTNTAATDALIQSITIEPDDSPFVVLDAPGPLPAGLQAGKVQVVTVGRVAAAQGSYQATLVVRGSANVVRVPLGMEVAAPGSAITQRFVAPSAAMLDILFVVDNSGSMSDDQEELATNFPLFLAQPQFNDGSTDLHLGVTTTDCDGGEEGRLIGDPLVVTSATPNMAAEFASNARVGTSGSGDEKGLLAMELALSPPNVPGFNDAFYRPEAALAVVIVSDEPDGSPDTVQHYVDFLRGIKGGGLAEGLVDLAAVMDGVYGTGYIEAVAAFGGMSLDITTSWGASLGTLADGLADLPQIFRLGDVPVAGVAVTVDGTPDSGVTLDAPNKMFALTTKAPVGSLVEVVYNGACSP